MSKYDDAIKLMTERFSKDSLISIATKDGSRVSVRMVDAYYEDGAFYTVTYALSNKMKQIAEQPEVAVCAIDWFSGHGTGENLGWVREEKNAAMMEKLRSAFSAWYTGGHVNEDDKNTCLLRVVLTDGIVIDHDKKYSDWQYAVDFVKKTA